MKCFFGGAAASSLQSERLAEENAWLQRAHHQEQRTRQELALALSQERAKVALLEAEISHAAQAAQELGESLCAFFDAQASHDTRASHDQLPSPPGDGLLASKARGGGGGGPPASPGSCTPLAASPPRPGARHDHAAGSRTSQRLGRRMREVGETLKELAQGFEARLASCREGAGGFEPPAAAGCARAATVQQLAPSPSPSAVAALAAAAAPTPAGPLMRGSTALSSAGRLGQQLLQQHEVSAAAGHLLLHEPQQQWQERPHWGASSSGGSHDAVAHAGAARSAGSDALRLNSSLASIVSSLPASVIEQPLPQQQQPQQQQQQQAELAQTRSAAARPGMCAITRGAAAATVGSWRPLAAAGAAAAGTAAGTAAAAAGSVHDSGGPASRASSASSLSGGDGDGDSSSSIEDGAEVLEREPHQLQQADAEQQQQRLAAWGLHSPSWGVPEGFTNPLACEGLPHEPEPEVPRHQPLHQPLSVRHSHMQLHGQQQDQQQRCFAAGPTGRAPQPRYELQLSQQPGSRRSLLTLPQQPLVAGFDSPARTGVQLVRPAASAAQGELVGALGPLRRHAHQLGGSAASFRSSMAALSCRE